MRKARRQIVCIGATKDAGEGKRQTGKYYGLIVHPTGSSQTLLVGRQTKRRALLDALRYAQALDWQIVV